MLRRPARLLACVVPLLLLLALACGSEQSGEAAPAEPASPPSGDSFTLRDVGFATPESVIHDTEADVYLVANIHGGPLDRDGNGFISRVSPDGEVLELKWIDGAAEGIALSAPKGMALVDDRLFVTDIDAVRIFDRDSGAPLGEISIGGARFLNDVAADGAGGVFVSDSGTGAGDTAAEAVYHVSREGVARKFAEGADLARPNGLVAAHGGLIMVTLGDAKVLRIHGSGERELIATLPSGALDGVAVSGDGRIIVSSWEGSTVYALGPDGGVTSLAKDLPAPADFGIDFVRGRLLVPLFNDDALAVRPLESQ